MCRVHIQPLYKKRSLKFLDSEQNESLCMTYYDTGDFTIFSYFYIFIL